MATFTKQNYEAVARVLRGCRPPHEPPADGMVYAQWERTCLAFINMFQQDNPSFSRERFLKACK